MNLAPPPMTSEDEAVLQWLMPLYRFLQDPRGTTTLVASDFTVDGGVLVGTGAGTWVEESGATLRTSIGVGTGDSPTFTALNLSSSSSILKTTDNSNFLASGGTASNLGANLFLGGNSHGSLPDVTRFRIDGTTTMTIDGLGVTLAGNLIIPSSGTIGPVGDTDLITLIPNLMTLAGSLTSTQGLRTTGAQYSPGFWLQLYGEDTPEHTNQTGSYDHTGGAAEQIFTLASGDKFHADDATNGNWIVLMGANRGAAAEIKEWIDEDNVVVDGLNWDAGTETSQSFFIYKHPSFVSGDGAKHEFSTEATGEFEVHSYGFTNGTMAHFKNKVAADDSTTVKIDTIGNGYSDLDTLRLAYETGDIQPGDANEVAHISIDESGATNADATTDIHGIKFEKTNANTTHTDAIHVGPGFTDALHITGTAAIDPAFGYEVSSGGTVETDRVNGAAGDGNAFLEAGNDLQIFDVVNDYILIGSAAEFEIIAVNLATGGSKDSNLEFYYTSDGAGTYTQFYPTDSTNGFQNSGTVTFSAPTLTNWQADDQAMDGGAITNAFYIAIKRTKLGAYTEPVEDYFKLYPDQEGGMSIRGDGVVQLPYLGAIPANPVNGMIWMESDGLHLYYGGAEKVVAGS